MQTKRIVTIVAVVIALTLVLATSSTVAGPPVEGGQRSGSIKLVGTVASKISYQGRLTDAAGNPLNGNYNLVFQLRDDATAGSQVGSDIVRNNVPVSNGLFTVELDVPHHAFNGQALWLRIQVNGQWLSPRQELLPAPYAMSLRPGARIEGDSTDPVADVINHGLGTAIKAQGAAMGIEATGMTGVHGEGDVGVRGEGITGVSGASEMGHGVDGQSGQGSGVYVASAGSDALRVQTAGQDGLRIFDTVGRDYIRAGSDADPDFRVQKDGLVLSDRGYRCGDGAPGCLQTGNADLAEQVNASEKLAAGDVVEIDPTRPDHFRVARTPYSKLVAGVISTRPAILMGVEGITVAGDGPEDERPPLALVGRVPVKVSTENGSIAIGDLLVASSTPGHAMRADNPPPGTILGKALEPLEKGTGTILVLLTLQ